MGGRVLLLGEANIKVTSEEGKAETIFRMNICLIIILHNVYPR